MKNIYINVLPVKIWDGSSEDAAVVAIQPIGGDVRLSIDGSGDAKLNPKTGLMVSDGKILELGQPWVTNEIWAVSVYYGGCSVAIQSAGS